MRIANFHQFGDRVAVESAERIVLAVVGEIAVFAELLGVEINIRVDPAASTCRRTPHS